MGGTFFATDILMTLENLSAAATNGNRNSFVLFLSAYKFFVDIVVCEKEGFPNSLGNVKMRQKENLISELSCVTPSTPAHRDGSKFSWTRDNLFQEFAKHVLFLVWKCECKLEFRPLVCRRGINAIRLKSAKRDKE